MCGCRFGEGLELEEQQWLVSEINSHIEEVQGAAIDYDNFPEMDPPKVVRDDDRFTSSDP